MEFPGLGVVPFEAPSEDLRPFMGRKVREFMRRMSSYKDGAVHIDLLKEECNKISLEFPDRQKEVEEEMMWVWSYLCTWDGKSATVTEDEYIDKWMERTYGNVEARKKCFEVHKRCVALHFATIDTNRDGVIDFDEFSRRTTYIDDVARRICFDLFDANKDGVIQKDELTFAVLMFFYVSGPDDKHSSMVGPIPDE